MARQEWRKIAIVGVGLLGGSVGMAALKRGVTTEVIGIGRHQPNLSAARRLNAVTNTTTNLSKGVTDADLIIICTPVENIVDFVRQVAAVAAPGTLITDVGSTKAQIIEQLTKIRQDNQSWNEGVRFIGSHPIAGNEKRGPQHAVEDLFVGRTVIVTPDGLTVENDLQRLKNFWKSLGAKVVQMTADEHDQAVAAISHLPHLLASTIAAATDERYVTITAGGWQDTTRVAAGDPLIWRQILLSNRQHVLASLAKFDEQLAKFRRVLEQNDAVELERLLADAKQVRDLVNM